VDRRTAIAEDLRTLVDDLKNLYESATTDPKERQWKERRFRALEAMLGALVTLVLRRVVLKLWGIITGEEPPKRPPTERHVEPRVEATPQPEAEPASGVEPGPVSSPETETTPQPAAEPGSPPDAVTLSSSSSSVK
jgi:hypothetical protein